MARKSRNQAEGRSRVTRGRKLHNLEDSETEEELRRFLKEGADFEQKQEEAEEEETGDRHRPYRIDQPESFGSLGQFWVSEN